jgi:4,5-DOPA dioxygenase extradiol
MTLSKLDSVTESFGKSDLMPVLFIGHGNPMNAIEENPFTRSLQAMAQAIQPKPKAILVVSAHWLTRGSFVCVNPKPETIHDFGGFPQELFDVQYPARGAPGVAREVEKLATGVQEDAQWGLDHGAWTILKHLYPAADIPVFQLSIDYAQPMQYHFDLGTQLHELRKRGVLIIGSGNIVHNLRMFFSKSDDKPFDWAIEFDEWVAKQVDSRNFENLIHYEKAGASAKLSVPTVDHYVPMLYSLALAGKNEPIQYTYNSVEASMSMRAFRIG